jgi:hypothetical protein
MRFPLYAALASLACFPLTATAHKTIKFADGTKPPATAGTSLRTITVRRGSVASYDEALDRARAEAIRMKYSAAALNASRMKSLWRGDGEINDKKLRTVLREVNLPARDIRLNSGLAQRVEEEGVTSMKTARRGGKFIDKKHPARDDRLKAARRAGYSFEPVKPQARRMSMEVKVTIQESNPIIRDGRSVRILLQEED